MFRNIVVPLDGSSCAASAFELALALGKIEGSTIWICSVADPSPTYGSAPTDLVQSMVAGIQHDAQRIVNEAVAKAKAAGIVAEGCALFGEPASAIVDYAEKVQADAIVLGTHGRSAVERLRIGSVAEAVLRSAPMPVISLREKASATAAP
jgi:nucleotide-binding universal stress UspA family protein